jgi:hypothetical protein
MFKPCATQNDRRDRALDPDKCTYGGSLLVRDTGLAFYGATTQKVAHDRFITEAHNCTYGHDHFYNLDRATDRLIHSNKLYVFLS